MCKCTRRGEDFFNGMFKSGADKGCGVATVVEEICRYPMRAGAPHEFIQTSLNNSFPTSPHLLPTQVHPQPSDLSTHKLLSSSASLGASPPPTPHQAHTLTPICCHVSPCLYPTPKILSITFSIPPFFCFILPDLHLLSTSLGT